MNKKTEKKKQ